VISSNLQKHYRQYLPDSDILVNPILVSEDSHQKIDWPSYHATEHRLKDLYKGKRLLVYSGSFGEKDGIFVLIEALGRIIRQYPEAFMVMTGRNDNEQLMEEVRKHISRLKLQDNTRMVGFVNADELLCYNSMADVLFVCRSNSAFANHGFPWKLGEYCMTSKPVIATDVSDIRMYFTDNLDLFIVEPDNPDAIAGKVLEIFGHYQHALDVARLGKMAALTNFGYFQKAGEVVKFIHPKQSNNS
jgi:phosphatidylinositol alpha-mannosyltransferase